MIKSRTITIKVDDDDVELNSELIERYKRITQKKRVTKAGIQKFYNKLIEIMVHKPQ
jgi:hypothetical protein